MITKEDRDLIAKIVERLQPLDISAEDQRAMVMVLIEYHGSKPGGALNLEMMVEGRLQDVTHDLGGLARHYNIETGKMILPFSPRFNTVDNPRRTK